MHDELQDQVIYGEYQIKYLEDEIIKEQRYQRRVRYDEKQNRRKILIFIALCLLFGFGLLFFTIWETYLAKVSSKLLLPISLILCLPMQIFMTFFLVICIFKLVKSLRRLHGDVDWKTFTYMRYDDMVVSSRAREKYLYREMLQTVAVHKMNQELLEERKLHPEPQEMKVINMEELKQIRDESAELPEETVNVKNMGHLLEK